MSIYTVYSRNSDEENDVVVRGGDEGVENSKDSNLRVSKWFSLTFWGEATLDDVKRF